MASSLTKSYRSERLQHIIMTRVATITTRVSVAAKQIRSASIAVASAVSAPDEDRIAAVESTIERCSLSLESDPTDPTERERSIGRCPQFWSLVFCVNT
eukprot:3128958-Pyramimonas_sp.AAC.1